MKKNGFLILALILFLVLVARAIPATAQQPQTPNSPTPEPKIGKIDAGLLSTLQAGETADFEVVITEQADLSAAYSMTDWNTRGDYVYQTLLETATRTQKPLLDYLRGQGLKYRSFIAGNEVIVSGGTMNAASALSAMPAVGTIRPTFTITLDDPGSKVDKIGLVSFSLQPWSQNFIPTTWSIPTLQKLLNAGSSGDSSPGVQLAVTDWGILDTKANQFWNTYNNKGDGMLVANIDTGVQWDHPALKGQFKCSNDPSNPACWSDPTGECGSGGACDHNGHGTHTMGTMVGSDDPSLAYTVGMAPHAQWIACKAFVGRNASTADLLSCADWILAPGGKPANRPDIVNNSWGGGKGDNWFASAVSAWRAAGIFPAFAAGNDGPGCGTIDSPGDYQSSFASAAHDSNRVAADFSSRGPSTFGSSPYTKPNLSAPGVNICSSVPGSGWDCGYSGTSMASPHTAGAVALLWACDPALVGQIDATFQVLQNNCDASSDAGSCGTPSKGNYTFGYGYLDVLQAAQATTGCKVSGTLKGKVTSGGAALAGVIVDIYDSAHANYHWVTTTDASGNYSQVLPASTYDIYYTKYGYVSDSYKGTPVYAGGTMTRNIDLAVARIITINGYVTDLATGYPLGATILFSTPQFTQTVNANPVDGSYNITLAAEDNYSIRVDAADPGYREQNYTSQAFDYDMERDFIMEVDPVICTAPGYRKGYNFFKDFEADNGSFTAAGSYSSWAWGVPTSGPNSAHSGKKVWATNLSGSHNVYENSYIKSPVINLSGQQGKSFYLHWWQSTYIDNGDTFLVKVSTDGGSTWVTKYSSTTAAPAWSQLGFLLDSSYAVTNFRVAFWLVPPPTGQTYNYGLYIDDVGIEALPALSESFEGASFLPSGWSVYDQDHNSINWSLSTANPYTTTHNVISWSNARFGGWIEDNWLVSPDIYVSGNYANDTLSFWDSTLNNNGEHHVVGYCDEASPGGCGSPPHNYALFDGFWPPQTAWTVRTFGFSNKQNHVVRVAWDYYGHGGTWYLDAISLSQSYGGVFNDCSRALAGPLTYTPPSLQASLNLGGATANRSLQIGNTGVSASGFYISEYNLGFNPALASQALHLPSVKPAAPPSASKTETLSLARSPSLENFTLLNKLQANGAKPSSLVSPDIARRISSVPAYALAWKSTSNYALYSFGTATPGAWTEVGDFGNLFLTGAAFVGQDTSQFYALGVYNNHLYSLNTSTATPTDLGLITPLTGHYWGGMTSGPEGKLYASSSDCHNSEIYTVDLASHTATPLFNVTNAPCLDSIAMNPLGQMYGLDVKIDSLVRIDMSNGNGTVVGALGYNASFNQEMAFDWMSGALYWAAFNNQASELRLIDPTTGASARIDTFPGPTWVTAFVLPGSISSDVPWLSEVPISGTLSAGGNKTINVTFTSPPVTNQPGVYQAQLRVGNDSLEGTGVVTATLNATIPGTWGYLHGVVSGLGPCDAAGGPLAYAQVQIYTAGDTLVGATQSDASGVYNYALLAGSYKVKASLLNYVSYETGALSVPSGGQMLSQDITLRRHLPCLIPLSSSLTGNVFAGNTLTLTLTISNTGTQDGPAVLFKHAGSQASTNLLQDPGFELYNSSSSPWQQYSLNFQTPLWANPSGTATPHTGDIFAWFGGYDRDVEEGTISQTVTIPAGSAGMDFWLSVPECANGTSDYMTIAVDGTELFRVDGTYARCGDPTYYLQQLNLSAYADGNAHSLEFFSHTNGGNISSFLVDDVALESPSWSAISWLTTEPLSVTVAEGTTQTFKVVFSAGSRTPNTYYGMLTVDDAPNPSRNIPANMVLGAPPTLLTAVAASQTQINLHWNDNSPNERAFFIERSPTGEVWKVLDRVRPDIKDYADTDIAGCNTTFYYRVRALTAGGYSAYTNVAHATTAACTPPAAPSNLQASSDQPYQISLNWTDNSDNENGFRIEWAISITGTWNVLTTTVPNMETYVDASLPCVFDRYYMVAAFNNNGTSTYTSPVHGFTPMCPPAAPTGLSASTDQAAQINLSWTDNSNSETGFRIEWSPAITGSWSVLTTTLADVQASIDAGLPCGTNRNYRVAAVNAGGLSAYTDIASGATLICYPTAPTGLSSSTDMVGQIALSWNDNANNETGFKIEWSPHNQNNWSLLTTTQPNVQSYPDSGLLCGTSRDYRVYAFNGRGNSGYSNVAAGATLVCPPAAPTNLTASTDQATQIALAWTDHASTETGFRVEWSPYGLDSWHVLTTTLANVQTYIDAGLGCGMNRNYRVAAVNAGGPSAYTNVASGATQVCYPEAPSDLLVIGSTHTSISLSWTIHSTNESGFKIERSLDGVSGWQEVGSVGAGVALFTDTLVPAGQTYYYRVYAYNSRGNSSCSNVAHAMTNNYDIWLPMIEKK